MRSQKTRKIYLIKLCMAHHDYFFFDQRRCLELKGASTRHTPAHRLERPTREHPGRSDPTRSSPTTFPNLQKRAVRATPARGPPGTYAIPSPGWQNRAWSKSKTLRFLPSWGGGEPSTLRSDVTSEWLIALRAMLIEGFSPQPGPSWIRGVGAADEIFEGSRPKIRCNWLQLKSTNRGDVLHLKPKRRAGERQPGRR